MQVDVVKVASAMRGSLIIKEGSDGKTEGPDMLLKLKEYHKDMEQKLDKSGGTRSAKPKVFIDRNLFNPQNKYHATGPGRSSLF